MRAAATEQADPFIQCWLSLRPLRLCGEQEISLSYYVPASLYRDSERGPGAYRASFYFERYRQLSYR